MKAAVFHFDEDLAGLLPKAWDNAVGQYHFTGPQSAKHLIEALGIPHTEVGGIAVNGQAAGLGKLVNDGDHVEVSGVGSGNAMLEELQFVVDGHLGRLNARLRMLGFDCLYRIDFSDPALAEVSAQDRRYLLTRDRRLLMRKLVTRGCLIRTLDPSTQLRDVVRRFGLHRWFRPFSRCIRCNHLLTAVDKQEILDRLQPLTRLYFDEFRICPSCKQIYWKGSHLEKMQKIIAGLDEPAEDHDPI